MSGKTEIRIFISCSPNAKDYATVKELAERLKNTGAKVILDNGNINAGSSAEREVFHKIAGCTHFLPIIGPDDLNAYADSNSYLSRKLNCAMQNGKKVIPILTDGLNYSSQPSQIPTPLKKLQSGISYSLSRKTLSKVADDLISTLTATSPNTFANKSATGASTSSKLPSNGYNGASPSNARPFNTTPSNGYAGASSSNAATSPVGTIPQSGFFSSLSESAKKFSPWLYFLVGALLGLLILALLNGFNNTNTNNVTISTSDKTVDEPGIKRAGDNGGTPHIPTDREDKVQVKRNSVVVETGSDGSVSINQSGGVSINQSGGGSIQSSITNGAGSHIQQQMTNSSVRVNGVVGDGLNIRSSNIQIQNKGMRGVFSNEDEKDFESIPKKDFESVPPSDIIKKIPEIKTDKNDNGALPDSCNTD